LHVAPPSWRLNAGWKPALHLKLGHYHVAMADVAIQGSVKVQGSVHLQSYEGIIRK
jgi:hypothetical protein